MRRFLTTVYLSLLTLVSVSCASVPEVESRLQSMRFYPNLYVVRAGDTLDTIAYRYQMQSSELVALNPGVEGAIKPGQRIAIRSEKSRTEKQQSHVVVSATSSRPSLGGQRITDPQAGKITEIPAVNRSYPQEEIVADSLDYEPVSSDQALLDGSLQQLIGQWMWPTNGEVAREFAPGEIGGQGVDIAGVPGQDVRAANDGTVVYSGRDLSGGGNLIIVRHPKNLMTTYSHTDSLYVAEDDRVLAGEAIASLGWNAARESVLRFEVRRDGNPLNPLDFLPAQ